MNMAMLLAKYTELSNKSTEIAKRGFELMKDRASEESRKENEKIWIEIEENRRDVAIEIADRLTDITKRQFDVKNNT